MRRRDFREWSLMSAVMILSKTEQQALVSPRFFTLRRNAGLFALALWFASLTQPVIWPCGGTDFFGRYPPYKGFEIMVTGWMGPLEGQVGWFANPLMIIVIGGLLLESRVGIWPALISLGLAASSFWWTSLSTEHEPRKLCEHGPGFYLWIACAVFLAATAIIERFMEIRARVAKANGRWVAS